MFRKTLLGVAGASALACAAPAQAQENYIGRIILVGYNFCPVSTVEANGQLLPISQYDVVFALLGTTYGGDGQTTFGVPDLRGRTPLGWNSTYQLGQSGGNESVTLTTANLPAHTHPANATATTDAANIDNPTNAAPADFPTGQPVYNNANAPDTAMAANTAVLQPMGNNQPLVTLSPFTVIRYCVVTEGLFPPQS